MSKEYGEYKIWKRVGGSGFGDCFAATKKSGSDKNAYILKTLIGNNITGDKIKTLQNEIYILDQLNQDLDPKYMPYIPVLYACDKYNYQIEENIEENDNKNIIIENKNEKKARPYFVIDYFSRGNLFMYVTKFEVLREKDILQEKHIKLIFKKILLGVQYCHNKNICHLDLKPANIVFDKNFNPIIIDYGLSNIFNGAEIKKGSPGTRNYKCPEMREKNEYNGFQADVFSLGAILFNLGTARPGFGTSRKDDPLYKFIIANDSKNYWNNFKLKFELSGEFKELYEQMVSHNPSKRPTINQILNSKWMKEKNDLKEKENLENEVKGIFNSLYKELREENEIKIAEELELYGFNTRGFENNNTKFNNYDLKPIKIPDDTINFNNYIIIKGYLNPINFMNNLVNKIENKFKKNFPNTIILDKNLGFEVTFEIENDDEDEDEEITMQMELFKYEDEKYLLEFIRIKGEFSHYYNKFLDIKKIIREEIFNN